MEVVFVPYPSRLNGWLIVSIHLDRMCKEFVRKSEESRSG
jgi:hypothetical protein